MFMWTAEAPESPAPVPAIVCIMSAASVMPRPAPPYASGMAMPSQPASASARWKSSGKPPSRSFAQPVVGVERRAEPLDRVADPFLVGREGEIHLRLRPDDLVRRLVIGRGVDHEQLGRRLARHREDVHHVGREVARVAGPELAALAVDLGERGALEHVADLLDPRVGVRQRALARAR